MRIAAWMCILEGVAYEPLLINKTGLCGIPLECQCKNQVNKINEVVKLRNMNTIVPTLRPSLTTAILSDDDEENKSH